MILLWTGSGAASTSTQGPGGNVAEDSVSQHQARLQAAAMAASIYEKSYVYPYANTILWYVFLLYVSISLIKMLHFQQFLLLCYSFGGLRGFPFISFLSALGCKFS